MLEKAIQCWEGDGSVPEEILAALKDRDAALTALKAVQKENTELQTEANGLAKTVAHRDSKIATLEKMTDVKMAMQLRDEVDALRSTTISIEAHEDALLEQEEYVRNKLEEERQGNIAAAAHDIAQQLNRMGMIDVEEFFDYFRRALTPNTIDMLAHMAKQQCEHNDWKDHERKQKHGDEAEFHGSGTMSTDAIDIMNAIRRGTP